MDRTGCVHYLGCVRQRLRSFQGQYLCSYARYPDPVRQIRDDTIPHRRQQSYPACRRSSGNTYTEYLDRADIQPVVLPSGYRKSMYAHRREGAHSQCDRRRELHKVRTPEHSLYRMYGHCDQLQLVNGSRRDGYCPGNVQPHFHRDEVG